MIRASLRDASAGELEAYEELEGFGPMSVLARLVAALAVGGAIALVSFGISWVVGRFTAAPATWTVPLVIGGIVAVLVFVALWFLCRGEDWISSSPERATEVVASVDAAWEIDDDSPWYRLVMRVEPGRYLLVNQGISRAPFGGEDANIDTEMGSQVELVMLGEGRHRRVVRSKATGPTIPVAKIEIYPWADPPEPPDPPDPAAPKNSNRAIPDGVYDLAELPEAVRAVVAPTG